MKQKTTLLIILAASVLLMAGAYVLYDTLSEKVDADQLVANQPSAPTDPGTQPTEDSTQPTEDSTQPTGDSTQPTEDNTQPIEHLAPDFTVYDANGNPVKLSDFIGKPVVLNFWASWCPPCKSEMPDFQEVYQELGGQVQFLMVNTTVSDTMADAKAFIQSMGYTFPVFYDTQDLASIAYGINSWPNTCFINAKGQLVARANGAISKATLLKGIGMITE